MCGRYTHLFTWRQLHRLLSITSAESDIPRRYNVAPSQQAPVVRSAPDGRELVMLKWGLVPFWAKDAKTAYNTINARAETAATSPAFRAAFKSRRCIVPVTGFYEWRKAEGGAAKQPFYITSSDESPLLFAGLWERWQPSESDAPLETFTILTTIPNELMSTVHNRMPVILAPEDVAAWLDPATPAESLQAMLRPYPAELMLARPISTRVNSPKHDDVSCIEPLDDH